MITLYGGSSPNAIKIVLMLEELGLSYSIQKVNTMAGEQFSPEFLSLNPLSKYPVIVDSHPGVGDRVVFESAAILIYLAETYRVDLLSPSPEGRWDTLQWLIAQVAYMGPMLGQHNHFLLHPDESNSYAAKRYEEQARRVYAVWDKRLESQPFVAGDFYGIADIATYPWAEYLIRQGFEWDDFPAIASWRDALRARPAVARTEKIWLGLTGDKVRARQPTAAELDTFFGRRGGSYPDTDMTLLDRNRSKSQLGIAPPQTKVPPTRDADPQG